MPVHKKIPDRKRLSVKDEQLLITTIRGATLIHGITRALWQDTNISPAFIRLPSVAEYSVNENDSHLTAPSAVHLKICVLSGSQHPELSVKA